MKVLEKFLPRNSFFRLKTCNFTKTEPFCRCYCIISVIQVYLQKVYFSYLLSKFLQQFWNSKNCKFSRASPKSCIRNQFVIIVDEIMYRELTFYLRNFISLISFLFYLYKAFILFFYSFLKKLLFYIKLSSLPKKCNNGKTLDVLMMC